MVRHVRFLLGGLLLLSLLTMPLAALAATNNQGIVTSYATDGDVRQGMIVAIKPSDSTKVIPLTLANVTDMFGVAISPAQAPLTLSGDASTQVYIATSGQYEVLVSTQNGLVKAGDYISVSSLNGIGMKATDSQATVLGRAAADMTSGDILQNNVHIRTASGTQTVAIGAVLVSLNIADNPTSIHGPGDLPGFLKIAGQNIADKPVAAPRVYLALAVLLAATLIGGSVLYSSVRNSLLSIGRNPLAKRSILGALLQAVGVGLAIFVLGLVSVYLLLKL